MEEALSFKAVHLRGRIPYREGRPMTGVGWKNYYTMSQRKFRKILYLKEESRGEVKKKERGGGLLTVLGKVDKWVLALPSLSRVTRRP